MKFKIGDRVEFLNEVGGGEVVGEDGQGMILVRDQDGFDLPYPEEDLIVRASWQPKLPDTKEFNSSTASKKEENHGYRLVPGKKVFMEVDLHIHMIADHTRNLSNHEMVVLQLDHFEKTLAEARNKKLQKVVYIHGIGKGRLRNELRKRLRDRSNCEFRDADYHRYGMGATEVKLWYN